MLTDPLVAYLKKSAAEALSPPLTGLVDPQGALRDNRENLPVNTAPGGVELASQDPGPTAHMQSKSDEGVESPLGYLFDGNRGVRKKYTDKEREFTEFDQGVVDRVLGL
jgi:hypothetical protein